MTQAVRTFDDTLWIYSMAACSEQKNIYFNDPQSVRSTGERNWTCLNKPGDSDTGILQIASLYDTRLYESQLLKSSQDRVVSVIKTVRKVI